MTGALFHTQGGLVVDRDARPGAGEGQGARAPDAAGTAGDEGNFVGEFRHGENSGVYRTTRAPPRAPATVSPGQSPDVQTALARARALLAARSLGLRARRTRSAAERLPLVPLPALALMADGSLAVLARDDLQVKTWEDLNKQGVRIAVPAGMQHVSQSAGLVALYWIIGRIGTAELAAANVLVNLMTVVILPGMGLAMAAATLVGQSLGAGQPDEARRWARDTMRIGLVALGLLGAPMVLAPDLILGLFLHNPDTVALARWPMRIAGLAVVFEGVKRIYMQVLMSAGDGRRVMRVSVLTQWFLFTPAAYLIGPVWGLGLLGIWVGQELYRLTQLGVFRRYWREGRWAHIRI